MSDSVKIKMLQTRFINGKLAKKGEIGETKKRDGDYLILRGWAELAPVEKKAKK